jgi:DNA repair exonuclease SbcCD ATPase subunit
MILRSVELENFGRFRGQVIEFRRGMNLVIGPNEAGKSTLSEAVPAVLFGTDRLERFQPWGRSVCSASLFFEGPGRTIQVKRNLVTDEVELVEKDDLYHVLSQFSGKVPLRGRSATCREYRALIESLLGISDERLFRATYFFGHHPQEWSGEELAQKLRSLVSGTAETDYATILDELLDEHFQLTSDNPWGRDKQKDREYEEVCQQLAEQGETAPALSVPVFVEIDNLADTDAPIKKLADELADDREEYEKGLRYVEHVRKRLNEKPEGSSPAVVEKKPEAGKPPVGKGSLSDQLVAVGLPPGLPRELPEVLSEAAKIRQELAALQQPIALLNSREKKIPLVPWLALCGVSVFLGATAAVAWWRSFQPFWIPLGSLAGCALLLSWGGWRYMVRKKALDECRKERNRLDQKKLAAQKMQAELSERCEALRLPSSAIDLVRLQKLVSKHHKLLEAWWKHGDSPVAGDEVNEGTSTSVCEEIHDAGDSTEFEDTEQELRQLDARMAEFAEELKNKELRLHELKSQARQSSSAQHTGATTDESPLYKRKLALEERITILRKAITLLADAVDEFGRAHLAGLNEEASKLFSKITGGRYPALKLDENMTPSVHVDGRRWMSVENFSRGTTDAVYLALRVALAKVRDDGRSLPLMLDDPFVHLDQKRLTTTLNLVDLASADGQLILFSHNLDLGKRAARERWHVVPLNVDSVGTIIEEGGEHAGQLHLL